MDCRWWLPVAQNQHKALLWSMDECVCTLISLPTPSSLISHNFRFIDLSIQCSRSIFSSIFRCVRKLIFCANSLSQTQTHTLSFSIAMFYSFYTWHLQNCEQQQLNSIFPMTEWYSHFYRLAYSYAIYLYLLYAVKLEAKQTHAHTLLIGTKLKLTTLAC